MYQLHYRNLVEDQSWQVFESYRPTKAVGVFTHQTEYEDFREVEAEYQQMMRKGFELRIVRVELMREGASPWPWEVKRNGEV